MVLGVGRRRGEGWLPFQASGRRPAPRDGVWRRGDSESIIYGARVLALSWSGGKDSSLALWQLGDEVRALLTTVRERDGAVTHHAVPGALLEAQAAAVGVPLLAVPIPDPCPDDVYAARMTAALEGVDEVAFGDLFLEDLRAWREERLTSAGRGARFPLWGSDTAALAREFVDAGFSAFVVSVDTTQLDASFAGRPFDASFLDALPAGVDPCGENGEFHTFVTAGPVLAAPIAVCAGRRTGDERFAWLELVAERGS